MPTGAVVKSGSKRTWIWIIALVFVVAGLGGYLLGNSSGEDLSAAKEEGAQAGHHQGVAIGTQQGYAAGRKGGRKSGFHRSFGPAYKAAYASAFSKAGLSVPDSAQIKVETQR